MKSTGSLICVVLVLLVLAPNSGLSADATAVSVDGRQVRYVSGAAVYIEEMVGDRLLSRYWSPEGKTGAVHPDWTDDAFVVRIQTQSASEQPGTLLSGGWRWVSASELRATDRNARRFAIELASSILPITVRVHTVLDGTPVLQRWLEITNTGNRSVALTELAPWSGRLWSGDAAINLGHSLRREVPWEGWFGWKPLSAGTNSISNNTDRLWDDPYFLLQNESNGEYFFGQLAWAANYWMEFNKEGGLSFKLGPTARAALRVLGPQETIATPAVHLGHVKGEFSDAVQAMHEHIRRSVFPTRKLEHAYRVQYLIPEDWSMTVYRGENFNEANMKKTIDVAAAVGIEAFILDGPMWGSAYGNWLLADKKRFPNGLAPLADYARKKGLLFGLYVEPEGGRDGFTSKSGWGSGGDKPDQAGITIGGWKESRVYREHPEWFGPHMNLNLSISEAAAYLESELARIIEVHKLDIYRHDQNGIVFYPPGPGAGQTLRDARLIESDYWRHYDALNRIFSRLHEKYPDVILQQAAAGNFRLDLGTAGVFHEQFTSDRATMPWVYRMLSGMSVFLPPETLVNANGMAWPKDQPDLDTTLRGTYALGNTPMIFNFILPKSVEELKPETRERFLHYDRIYKNFIRPLIPTSRVYHHAPVSAAGSVESGDWFAMEFGSPDRKKGWAVIIRLSKTAGNTYLLMPKGLSASDRYAVTFDNSGKSEMFAGGDLISDGIRVRLSPERSSELLLFERK